MNKKSYYTLGFFSLIMALGLLLSCKKPSSGTTPDNPFNKYDRSTLLINLSQNIAIPTWKALSQSVDSLSALSNRFNQNPKIEELDSLRIQWNQTQHCLKLAEAMQFYPNTELSTYANLDFWPVRTTDVESYITNTDTFNASVISTKGTTIKGMPVLGYLLYSQTNSQDQLATFINGKDGLKRRNYLVALTKVLKYDVQYIIKKWTDNASTFQNNTQQDVNGSINLTVNTLVQMMEVVKNTKLGRPAGKKDGRVQTDKLESIYPQRSVQDMIDNLDALETIFTGGQSKIGLYDMLTYFKQTYQGDLPNQIKSQFDNCRQKLKAIPTPISTALNSNPKAADDAYLALKQLLVSLKVDMASQLGVVITFTDNDGD